MVDGGKPLSESRERARKIRPQYAQGPLVRVATARGWVVLASDATHFYANLEQGRPFPIVYNVADMLEGHRTIERLAETPHHIIPGHDPLVMRQYPAPRPELEAVVVRLDVMPKS